MQSLFKNLLPRKNMQNTLSLSEEKILIEFSSNGKASSSL
jgi:hypothetical protein